MTLPVDQVFELLPAWFRSRDSGLVAGVALLTAAEQAELTALLAVVNPDLMQQARLDYLVAKRDRGPLASLLAVIGEQVLVIEENLRQRYDDQFIETCAELGDPVHRRRDRLPGRACGRAGRVEHAGRSRAHDLVSPAQGNRRHARSSSRATSPAGAPARSSSSSAWATPST